MRRRNRKGAEIMNRRIFCLSGVIAALAVVAPRDPEAVKASPSNITLSANERWDGVHIDQGVVFLDHVPTRDLVSEMTMRGTPGDWYERNAPLDFAHVPTADIRSELNWRGVLWD